MWRAQRPDALDVQNDILIIHRRIGEIYGYTKVRRPRCGPMRTLERSAKLCWRGRRITRRLRRSVADLYQAQGRTLRFAEDLSGALVASDRALELYRFLADNNADDLTLRQDEADALTNSGMALARLAAGKRRSATSRKLSAISNCSLRASLRIRNGGAA